MPGCRRTAMPKQDTEHERGDEQHEGDEQVGLRGRDVVHLMFTGPRKVKPSPWTVVRNGTRSDTAVHPVVVTIGVAIHRVPRGRRSGARPGCAGHELRGRASASGTTTSTSRGGSPSAAPPPGTTSRVVGSYFAETVTVLVVLADRARACSRSGGTGRSSGSWSSAMAVEGAVYVDRHLLRHPQPARGAAPRRSHRRRQLPVGPHRRVGGALRLVGDRRLVAHPEPVVAWRSRHARVPRSAHRRHLTGLPRHAQPHRRDLRCRSSAPAASSSGYVVGARRLWPMPHERRVEQAEPHHAPGPGGGLMTSIAVVAHARKIARRRLDRAAQRPRRRRGRRSDLVRGAQEQVRARSACARRIDEGADLLFVWGGDGMVQRCIDAVGTEAGRRSRSCPPAPATCSPTTSASPIDLAAGGRGRAARRPPHDRRRPGQRRAVRGDGRHRARRAHDPRRRPRA